MKRTNRFQQVRIAVLTVSTALFPLSFYYLSPVIPLQGSLNGVVTGSLVMFALLTVAAMVLGRSFCSWLCPAGGLQDQIALSRTRVVNVARLSWVKYVVWVAWLTVLLSLFYAAGGVTTIDVTFATEHGLSAASFEALVAYGCVVSVFMALPLLVGRRAACHTLCWIAPFMVLGRRLARALRIPSLHIHAQPDRCVNCKQCTSNCPMSLDVNLIAKTGQIDSDNCILCGRCVAGCKRKVLSMRW
ncbi:MAG: 4Fe-4S binding protein [Reinekea sp.]|nr:4Fe-4S binding protein [Reinekea sp.]